MSLLQLPDPLAAPHVRYEQPGPVSRSVILPPSSPPEHDPTAMPKGLLALD